MSETGDIIAEHYLRQNTASELDHYGRVCAQLKDADQISSSEYYEALELLANAKLALAGGDIAGAIIGLHQAGSVLGYPLVEND